MRHSFSGVSSSKSRTVVLVSPKPNPGVRPEIVLHLASGSLWLSIEEARHLSADILEALEDAERKCTDVAP